MTTPDLDALDARLIELHELAWRSPTGLEKAIAVGIVQELITTSRSLIAEVRELRRQRDEARAALVWRPTHRHRKRGSVYQRERDNVEIQTSRPIVEGDIISVYVGKDGKPWGRLNEEFEDGRFEALSALPPPAGSETGQA